MVQVRTAVQADRDAIRAVHLAAFPTAVEADLIEALARDGDLAISLVAEAEGAVVGHIVLSPMQVRADGVAVFAFGLGPVAVLPERQGAGVGAALIEAGVAAAKASGAALLFVLGDPAYYGRFGFDPAEAATFASPYAGPYFMALRLSGERAAAGNADYAPAFAELG